MADAGLVVIGSGPAGTSAALGYRGQGGTGPVVVVAADLDLPYERPPLSKDFLSGESVDAHVPMQSDGDIIDADVQFRLGSPVTGLDPSRRLVRTGSQTIEYSHCVLATGAEPVRPLIPGADGARVHTLRSVRDAARLAAAADSSDRVMVVGSGFIGCEAASSLAKRGLQVVQLSQEPAPQAARLGPWVGTQLAGWLAADGVELIANRTVEAIVDEGNHVLVHTSGSATVRADLVLLATGVAPQSGLATGAGLALEQGRIRVDSGMRTNVPTIFAAGDVAFAVNSQLGRAISVEHWEDARVMGKIAGANAAGGTSTWGDVPGFWSTIGDRTLKYAAWGQGFDEARVVGDVGEFAVWYGQGGRTVGVLTFEQDAEYERGLGLVAVGAPLPG